MAPLTTIKVFHTPGTGKGGRNDHLTYVVILRSLPINLCFFPSNEHTWAPDSCPRIFFNSVSNSPRYWYLKFDWPLLI